MSTPTYPWSKLVQDIQDLRPAVRMKWSGDNEASSWNPWLIMPVDGMLETGQIGPVLFREVEWVEIDSHQMNEGGRLVPTDQSDKLVRALRAASIDYVKTDAVFCITANAR